jgi:hypothetical protein
VSAAERSRTAADTKHGLFTCVRKNRRHVLREGPGCVRGRGHRDGVIGVTLSSYTVLLAIPAIVFASLYATANAERRRADDQAVRATAAAKRADDITKQTLETLEWVFNHSANIPFDQAMVDGRANAHPHCGPHEASRRRGVSRNHRARGTHGRLHFIRRANGDVELATNENVKTLRAGDVVDRYSEPYMLALSDRQSTAMRELIAEMRLPFRLVTVSYGEQRPVLAYPDSGDDVDAWNRIAAENHRVSMKLMPGRT